MTGVRIYDPNRGSRIYLHTDPRTGRLMTSSSAVVSTTANGNGVNGTAR